MFEGKYQILGESGSRTNETLKMTLSTSAICLLVVFISAIAPNVNRNVRKIRSASIIALCVAILIVILHAANLTLYSGLYKVENENHKEFGLIIRSPEYKFSFRGIFLDLSLFPHDYLYQLSSSSETFIGSIEFQDVRINMEKQKTEWLYEILPFPARDRSFRVLATTFLIDVNDEDIDRLIANVEIPNNIVAQLKGINKTINWSEVQTILYPQALEGEKLKDDEAKIVDQVITSLLSLKPIQTSRGRFYIPGLFNMTSGLGWFAPKDNKLPYGISAYAIDKKAYLCLIFENYAKRYLLRKISTDNHKSLWEKDIVVSGEIIYSPLILNEDWFYLQTNTGYWAYSRHDGSMVWPIRNMDWYKTILSNPSHNGLLLVNDIIYGFSPSGYLFSLNASDGSLRSIIPISTKEFIRSQLKLILGIGGYYYAVIFLLLCLGLYRVHIYIAESGLHTLCLLLALHRPYLKYAVQLSPLFFDHISSLKLPLGRWLLKKIATSDQKLFSIQIDYLYAKTQHLKLAASFFGDVQIVDQSHLFITIGRSLQTKEHTLITTLAKEMKGDHPIGDLTRSYNRLLSNPTDLLQLEIHTAILQKFAARGYQHAHEILMIYQIFIQFLTYRRMSDLVSADQALAEILKLSHHELLNSQVVDIFNIITEIANDLSNYDVVDSYRDKQYYLSEARIKLYEISRQAQALYFPDQEIFLAIIEKWQGIIAAEAKALRGPAEMGLEILSQSVNNQDQWHTILVNVSNTGQSPAENVTVKMLENENLLVRDQQKSIRLLGTSESSQLEYAIYPQGNPTELRCYFDLVFDDFQRKGKLRPFADIIKFAGREDEFRRMPNPYVVGTPLQNEKVFFGRKKALDFALDNLSSGEQNNALIFFGQRRVGKSSLLYRLMESPASAEYLFVLIDCQGFGDADTAKLFYRICQGIYNVAIAKKLSFERPDLKKFKEDAFLELDGYLDRVEQSLEGKKLALMFDEYEYLEYKVKDGSVSSQLFNKLRSLLQHRNQKFAFIFVGTHRLTELTFDYWSFLFNTALYYEIGMFDEHEARALVTEPVKGYFRYDDLAVEKALRVTGLHPYFI